MSNIKYQISNKKEKSRSIGDWRLDIRYWIFPSGFTLIELLIAVGIFAVVGTIAVSVLSFTLRGSKKSDSIEVIRQSGDAALSKMVRTIRYAKSLDSPSCTPAAVTQEISVTSLTDSKTTYSCTAMANAITENAASLIDTNTTLVQNCSFECRQPSTLDMPSITIKFTLVSKDTTGFFENKVSIPFETSVSMRNVNQ